MRNHSIELEVVGDEMEPKLLEGDIVTVNLNEQPTTNAKDLAVVEVGGNYHICRLAKYGRQLLLLHENGSTIAIWEDKVKIIGKVVDSDDVVPNHPIQKNNHSATNTMAIT